MKQPKSIIIQGSSRSNGDTASVVNRLSLMMNDQVLDLNQINFSDYDYEARNKNDDFLPTIRNHNTKEKSSG